MDTLFPTQSRGRAGRWMRSVTGRFLGDDFSDHPEQRRLAGLVTGFGFLGVLFGAAYAIFYTVIGHHLGAEIIVACSAVFGLTPFLMRWTRSAPFGGHLLCFTLVTGFSALCLIEDGLHGHAIAWLATVPLCALLLLGRSGAWWWCLGSLLATSGVATATILNWHPPATYDPEWHALISAVGYGGLIAFMFALGIIFETGRARAFHAMTTALERLEKTNARLEHLNREKNEFLSIAAHDLKSPLTTIITGAELLREGHPEVVHEVADNIMLSGTRMRDLVRDLLDVNAIEEGRFSTNLAVHDLVEITRAAMVENETAATSKRSTLILEDSVVTTVRVDRSASIQILDNLISNALKYSPPQSRIRLNVGSQNGFGYVQVHDQGPGISDSDRSRLFRKFTRLSAKPTAGESSNGLGLCIVKRLVETMGGSVECLSSPGAGATFVVRLPKVNDGDSHRHSPDGVQLAPASTAGPR
jgi:signal transduction histidine kinase